MKRNDIDVLVKMVNDMTGASLAIVSDNPGDGRRYKLVRTEGRSGSVRNLYWLNRTLKAGELEIALRAMLATCDLVAQ